MEEQTMKNSSKQEKINRSEEEWKELLSDDEYRVLREKGTDPPFRNKYNSHYENGRYVCRGCGQPLFDSETKYDSGSGWPSYTRPVSKDRVIEKEDHSLFMNRIEILCSNCESHLGHVFTDGPDPEGLRYCMNSTSLTFIPEKDKTEQS